MRWLDRPHRKYSIRTRAAIIFGLACLAWAVILVPLAFRGVFTW